jgi:serine/threonine protein phosphatase PrpC
MKLQIVARTDVGKIRDHNEDNFIVSPDLEKNLWSYDQDRVYSPSLAGSLLVVADGMGGMNAGEVASRIAVEAVREIFPKFGLIPTEQVPDAFTQIFVYVNNRIVQHAQENPETEGMGTTLILVWLREDVVHVGWIGDSRAYLLRPGEDLRKISKDHSLVQQWIDEGKLNDEQAFYHPQNNIVTKSLGDPSRVPEPDYERHNLKAGDRLLVCSDGLNGMLLDPQIQEIMLQYGGDLKKTAESLVNAALKAGGKDNITLLMAYVGQAEGMMNSIVVSPKKKSILPKWVRFIAVLLPIVLLVLVAQQYRKPSVPVLPEKKQSNKDSMYNESQKPKPDSTGSPLQKQNQQDTPSKKGEEEENKPASTSGSRNNRGNNNKPAQIAASPSVSANQGQPEENTQSILTLPDPNIVFERKRKTDSQGNSGYNYLNVNTKNWVSEKAYYSADQKFTFCEKEKVWKAKVKTKVNGPDMWIKLDGTETISCE